MIEPVLNKVLIKPEHTTDVSHGGLIISVTKKVPSFGVIVQISEEMDGWYRQQIKEGDRIHFFNTKPLAEGEFFLIDVEQIDTIVPEGVKVKYKAEA